MINSLIAKVAVPEDLSTISQHLLGCYQNIRAHHKHLGLVHYTLLLWGKKTMLHKCTSPQLHICEQ